MTEPRSLSWAGLLRSARGLTAGWALFGAALLVLVISVNVVSIFGSIFNMPVLGEMELTEVGVAVAAFTFLPYCQMHGANIIADVFTANAPEKLKALFDALGTLVAFAFSVLLLNRMYHGLLDQKDYDYLTAILQLPYWYFYVPILISLALLVLSTAICLVENILCLSRS